MAWRTCSFVREGCGPGLETAAFAATGGAFDGAISSAVEIHSNGRLQMSVRLRTKLRGIMNLRRPELKCRAIRSEDRQTTELFLQQRGSARPSEEVVRPAGIREKQCQTLHFAAFRLKINIRSQQTSCCPFHFSGTNNAG